MPGATPHFGRCIADVFFAPFFFLSWVLSTVAALISIDFYMRALCSSGAATVSTIALVFSPSATMVSTIAQFFSSGAATVSTTALCIGRCVAGVIFEPFMFLSRVCSLGAAMAAKGPGTTRGFGIRVAGAINMPFQFFSRIISPVASATAPGTARHFGLCVVGVIHGPCFFLSWIFSPVAIIVSGATHIGSRVADVMIHSLFFYSSWVNSPVAAIVSAATRIGRCIAGGIHAPFLFLMWVVSSGVEPMVSAVKFYSIQTAYVTLRVLLAVVKGPLGYVVVFVVRYLFSICLLTAVAIPGAKAAGAVWHAAAVLMICAFPAVNAMPPPGPAAAAIAAATVAGAAAVVTGGAIAVAAAVTARRRAAPKPKPKPWKELVLNFTGVFEFLNTFKPAAKSTDEKYWGIVFLNWGRKWAFETEQVPSEIFMWVKGTGAEATVEVEYPTRFLAWIFEGIADQNTEVDFQTTSGIYHDALKAVQWFVNIQLEAVGASRTIEGYVRNMPGVKTMTDRVNKASAASALTDHEDLQGDVDPTLTKKQWCDIAELLLRCTVVDGFRLTPLDFSMTLFIIFMSRALAARGEDLRGMVVGGFSWVNYEGVGPMLVGMGALMIVLRSGKLNRSGRRTRSGMLPHKNPLLCPINALGLSLLYRWLVNREPIPDWGDGEYATLFRPVLRSATDGLTPMSWDRHDVLCRQVFSFFQIITSHSTHHMRGDTARYLELCLVSIELIKKHMNRVDNAHANSYGTGAAIGPMLGIAGFSTTDPQAALAPHLLDSELLDGLVNLVLPWLADEEAKVAAASELHKTSASVKSERLRMRQESVKAIRRIIAVVVQCMAARPQNASNLTELDRPAFHEEFSTNTVYKFLADTGFFATPAFQAFKAEVRSAEDREASLGATSAGAEQSPTTQIVSRLAPQLQVISTSIHNIQTCMAGQYRQVPARELYFNPGDAAGSSSSSSSTSSSRSSSRSSSSSSGGAAGGGCVRGGSGGGGGGSGGSSSAGGGGGTGAASGVACRSRSRHTHVGAGQVEVSFNGVTLTAQDMFDSYWTGPAGRPHLSYRQLEAKYGNKWRNGSHSNAQGWSERSPIYRFIERRMALAGSTATAVVEAIKVLADAAGSQGKSRAPNWKKVARDLKQTPEEAGYQATVKARQEQNKTKRHKAAAPETELVVTLRGDGSVVEEEEHGPIFTQDTHHGRAAAEAE